MGSLKLKHIAGNTFIIPAPAVIGLHVQNSRAILIDSGNDGEDGRQILKILFPPAKCSQSCEHTTR